ncbi:LuxR C-terminal-related transcriptional regulator [Rhodoferax sediminis]|nr:LuxR C-terminal-related transcriptional regulator [Rhodoferax sediminis]
MAESLHVSVHTAKLHVAQIIGKLNVHSRAHAVAKALQAGLLQG